MVEYVLLLVIAVGIAAMLVRQLISRSSDDPGVIVAKWQAILSVVGEDKPDRNK